MGNFVVSFLVTAVSVLMVRKTASQRGLEHIPANGSMQCCLEIALQLKYFQLMSPKICHEICNNIPKTRCFKLAHSDTLQSSLEYNTVGRKCLKLLFS